MEELDWSVQSSDLNPIEHLWDELERRMQARPSRPTSVSDLTYAFLEEWSKSPLNTLLNLVKSLPRRDEAVIAADKLKELTGYMTYQEGRHMVDMLLLINRNLLLHY